jgi:hypothetical protein
MKIDEKLKQIMQDGEKHSAFFILTTKSICDKIKCMILCKIQKGDGICHHHEI